MPKDIESNILKYYLISIFGGFWFILPISILYLQSFGLSYTQIGILEFVAGLFAILLEIPTGVFADLIGRKWSVFIACIFWVISMAMIGMGSTFIIFLVGFALWGISEAFFSGAISALLYDSLKKTKMEHKYLKIRGKMLLLSSIALIFGSILGAYLYGINIRLPWLVYAFTSLITVIIALTMTEPYKSNKKYNLTNQLDHIGESFKFTFTHKEVRWLIIFSVLSIVPIYIFLSLMEQPYLVKVGFSITSLGIIYAMTRGGIGLLATFIFKIEEKLGEAVSFFLVTLIYAIGFILLGLINLPIVVLILILMYFARDYQNVLIETYINKHINSKQRATVLSIQNLSISIAITISVLIGGLFLDMFSLNQVLIVLGILTFVIIIPYLISKYRTIANPKII